ncbi:MAG: DHHW family protein [Peptostreptococcus sp.]|uniref:DHHW family protein n=1 Tax=Peptostreptococcus sp. TaxID=1262 RepID=UPI002FCA5913
MSKKRKKYVEPEMPDSLKKLLDLDVESDPSYIRKATKKPAGTANRPNNKAGSKKKPNSKKQQSSKKQRPSSSKTKKKQQPINTKAKSSKKPSQARPTQARPSQARPSQTRPTQARPVNGKQRTYGSRLEQTQRISKDKIENAQRKQVQKKKPQKKKKVRKRKSANFLQIIIYSITLFFNFIFRGGDKKKYVKEERKRVLDYRFYRNLTIVSMLVIVVMTVAVMATPSQKVSVAENRELQQKPKFSMSKFVDGSYSKDYAKYMSDQFPKRSSFIKTKANMDMMFGKKEINGVYVCKDGYLMEGFKKADQETTKEKMDAVNTFVTSNPKLKTSMMIVPNKVEIYNNLLPANAPVDSQAEYLKELSAMADNKIRFINLIDDFNKVKNSEQLYFKTDHHWTSDGAYTAYLSYCKKLGMEPASESTFTKTLATDKFYGSLYYKNGAQIGSPDDLYLYVQEANNPLITKYYDTKKKVPTLYDPSKLEGRDPYEVFTGGNHTQIKIRTNVDTDKKLLLVKDSYANSMLPFLVNNYAEINVIDLRYYTGTMEEVINNNDITDVLLLYNVNTFNTDASILSINSKSKTS